MKQSEEAADDVTVVVLGLMGAGKTTVGRELARQLGRPLRDSDADIEAARGMTAAQIVAADGVQALHRLEAEHLLQLIGQPVVVAAAASVADDPRCQAALRHAAVVWLDGSPELLAGRFGSADAHRPQYAPDVLQMLRTQAATRNPAFQRVATVRVDVSAPPAEVIAEALAGLRLALYTSRRR